MHTLARQATPPAVAHKRVVLALTPSIKKYCERSANLDFFSPETDQWVDVSNMDAQQWEETLLELNPTVLVTGWGTPSLPQSYLDTEGLRLRYVCHTAGGVRALVPRQLIERGLLVSNWAQTISYTIAEHAVLLVLGSLRSMPAWNGFLRSWEDSYGREDSHPLMKLSTRSLRGKRVGLHGFGGIAREIAELLRPFRVELTAYSKGVPKSLFKEYDVEPVGSLEELFTNRDIVIECEALTDQTRGTVNERILRLLPKDAVFVNVGRAALVDEAALIKIAQEGILRFGLDVYHKEPMAAHYPLLDAANVLLSPHSAGPTEDTFPIVVDFALNNLQRFLKGEEVEGLVSLELYDRTT